MGIRYGTNPKIEIIRMAFSQQIHHRAQLSVYLRLLNIPIPEVMDEVPMKVILNNATVGNAYFISKKNF